MLPLPVRLLPGYLNLSHCLVGGSLRIKLKTGRALVGTRLFVYVLLNNNLCVSCPVRRG